MFIVQHKHQITLIITRPLVSSGPSESGSSLTDTRIKGQVLTAACLAAACRSLVSCQGLSCASAFARSYCLSCAKPFDDSAVCTYTSFAKGTALPVDWRQHPRHANCGGDLQVRRIRAGGGGGKLHLASWAQAYMHFMSYSMLT